VLDGNNWTGLSQIGNGEWGMWGHENNAIGSLIMYGDRQASYVNLANNNLNNVGNAYFNGNVGIGTTSPTASLHVAGNIWASGSSGHITASANISASGDLTATTGSFGRVETNDISASGLLYVNEIQDIATINHDNNAFGNLDFTSAGTLRLRATNSTSYGLKFFGGAQSSATPYIDTDSHTTFLLKVNGTERIAINSSGLTLIGNITSSANISASGTITANAFVGPITGTVTGTSTGLTGTPSILVANITSSGNISASGTITANSFVGALTGNASTATSATVTTSATSATTALPQLQP
jgi:hypothetical protein